MFQAADTCPSGHFYTDEAYGYWIQDFQMVLAGPKPMDAFRTLTWTEDPLGRVYGLAGLRVLDSAQFEEALRRTAIPDDSVVVAEACRVSFVRLPKLVDEVRAGMWTGRLTRPRVDMH